MATFNRESQFPALARYGHAGVVYENRAIITGGYTGAAYLDDVWETSDGRNLKKISSGVTNSFTTRSYHAMVVHNGRIYLSGGNNGSALSDVWESQDGKKWKRIQTGKFPARYGHFMYSLNGFLYMGGGYSGSAYLTDLWRSRDGVTWNQINTGYTLHQRAYAGTCVYDNRMFISGGQATAVLTDCRSTIDGQEWKGDAVAEHGALTGHSLTVFDKKMVIVGGSSATLNSPAMKSELWYSFTGIEWYLGDRNVGFTRHGHVALPLNNRLAVFFGHTGSAASGDIWISKGVEFKANM